MEQATKLGGVRAVEAALRYACTHRGLFADVDNFHLQVHCATHLPHPGPLPAKRDDLAKICSIIQEACPAAALQVLLCAHAFLAGPQTNWPPLAQSISLLCTLRKYWTIYTVRAAPSASCTCSVLVPASSSANGLTIYDGSAIALLLTCNFRPLPRGRAHGQTGSQMVDRWELCSTEPGLRRCSPGPSRSHCMVSSQR